MNDVQQQIAAIYAHREKPALRLRQIVALVLDTPRGIEIQERYLTGTESVSGSDLGDRLYAARELREQARAQKMPIADSIKDLDVAKAVRKEMRIAGAQLTRGGRIMLELAA
jgi:hypothetical protein